MVCRRGTEGGERIAWGGRCGTTMELPRRSSEASEGCTCMKRSHGGRDTTTRLGKVALIFCT